MFVNVCVFVCVCESVCAHAHAICPDCGLIQIPAGEADASDAGLYQ